MSIINSNGFIKYVITIVLTELNPDGTINHIEYELKRGNKYEIKTFSKSDGMIYTVVGKFHSYGRDPMNNNDREIDFIILDCSTEKESKLVRIYTKSIRSINLIEEFE